MDHEAAKIIERMNAVRSQRVERLAEFSVESGRLADWREHVRSAPLATFSASVAAGLVVASAWRASSQPTAFSEMPDTFRQERGKHPVRTVAKSLAASAWSFAMPMAVGFLKQRMTAGLKHSLEAASTNKLREHAHG